MSISFGNTAGGGGITGGGLAQSTPPLYSGGGVIDFLTGTAGSIWSGVTGIFNEVTIDIPGVGQVIVGKDGVDLIYDPNGKLVGYKRKDGTEVTAPGTKTSGTTTKTYIPGSGSGSGFQLNTTWILVGVLAALVILRSVKR